MISKTARDREPIPSYQELVDENHSLKDEIQSLRARLEEAEELKRAISEGDLDALIIPGPEGELIFTLDSADRAYRVLVETMNEGTATLAFDGTILYCNHRFAELLMMPPQAIVGTSISRFIAPESELNFNALLKHKMKTGEINLRAAGGKSLPVYLSISSMQAESSPDAWCIVVTDLTEQKKNEEIIEAERLARSIIEQAAETIVVCDTSGRITRFSTAMLKLCGCNPTLWRFEDLINLRSSEGADAGESILPVSSALKGSTILGMEASFESRDRLNRFHLLLNSGPLKNEDGEIIGCVVTLTDVTELKQAEKALEERARLLDLSYDAILIRDTNDRIIYWNLGAQEIYGYTKEEALGHISHKLLRTEFPQPLEGIFELLKCEGRWTGELTHTCKDGRKITVDTRWALDLDPQGNPAAILETNRDITERKRAEESLKYSEASLARAQRIAHLGSWEWVLATDEVFGSEELYRMFGLTSEPTTFFQQYIEVLAPEDRQRVLDALDNTIKNGIPFNIDYRTVLCNGTSRFIHAEAIAAYDKGRPVKVFGIALDITERKQAEEVLQQAYEAIRVQSEELQAQSEELQAQSDELREALEALSESEERYRLIFDNSLDAIFLTDPRGAGKVISANPAACRMLGYPEEEMIGKSRATMFRQDEQVLNSFLDEREHTGSGKAQIAYRRKDGSSFIGELSSTCFIDTNGEPRSVAIVRDITERKRAEEELAAAHSQIQSIIDNTPDLIYAFDPEERFVLANRAVANLLSSTPDRMIGKRRHEFMPKEDADWHEANDRQAFEAGGAIEFEECSHLEDHTITWLTKKFPLRNAEGRIYAVAGISADITGRKRAEKALRSSIERLDLALEASNAGTWEWDLKTNGNIWSEELWRLYGLEPHSCKPSYEAWLQTAHPADRDLVERKVQEAAASGTELNIEWRVLGPDGTERWLMARGRPQRNAYGQVESYIGVVIDISGRKQTEEQIRWRAEELETIMELTPVAIWIGHDPQNYNITGNRMANEFYEAEVGENVSANVTPVRRFFHKGRELAADELPMQKASLKDIEIRNEEFDVLLPSGEWRALIGSASPLHDANGHVRGSVGAFIDITRRKLAEEALKKAHDHLGEKVAERTAELEEAYNSLLENEMRLSEAHRIAHIGNWDWNLLTDELHWSDEIYRIFQLDPLKLVPTYNEFLNHVDPEDQSYVHNATEKALNGEPYDVEFRIVLPDGEKRIVHSQGEVVFDEKHAPIRMRGVLQDITERKQAEEALERVEKIRIKEIHHRIKNNLQVISSLLDLQAEKFEEEKVKEAFREGQNRVFSMSLLHEELYKGEGIDKLDFSAYLKKLAKNLLRTYNLQSDNIHLSMDLEANAFLDMDTAVPLGIIVNELISNSLKHAFTDRQEGEIRIGLCREEIESDESTNFILAVSDNGVGIPENIDLEDLESLGLQLVTTLVDQLDGEFELKRNNGTEFFMRFTVTEKA